MKTVSLVSKNNNNIIEDLIFPTTRFTSEAMTLALDYLGLDVPAYHELAKGSDCITSYCYNSKEVKSFYKKEYPQQAAAWEKQKIYPPNENHYVLSFAVNSLFKKEQTKFITKFSLDSLKKEIDQNKPVVLSVKTEFLDSACVLVGYHYDESGLLGFVLERRVGFKNLEKFTLTVDQFTKYVKPFGKTEKWAHVFSPQE